MSSVEELNMRARDRKDEIVAVPSQLREDMFPGPWGKRLWINLNKCVGEYYAEYDMDVPMTSYSYKVHNCF